MPHSTPQDLSQSMGRRQAMVRWSECPLLYQERRVNLLRTVSHAFRFFLLAQGFQRAGSDHPCLPDLLSLKVPLWSQRRGWWGTDPVCTSVTNTHPTWQAKLILFCFHTYKWGLSIRSHRGSKNGRGRATDSNSLWLRTSILVWHASTSYLQCQF